ncbi:putative DNA-binding domain-containing protein [Bdellovibrio bacteriovorus]|uniref:HvfC/BufC family peptide modification chaperone n=1 Tax=Bdellovibrio bacteriovorus TaxID=959 RepID=UPI0035A69B0E
MKLSELQSLFKKNILAPEADPSYLEFLKPAGKLSLEQAFQIYHRTYLARLTEALRSTYPAVAWVLGDNFFNELCRKYIEAQPSVAYNLSDYGETFPGFIQETSAAKGIPFLPDLAKFEWIYKEVQHAGTPDPLPVETIQELLNSDDVKMHMIDAMELFESNFAVYDIWEHRFEPAYMFEDVNWNIPQSLLIHKKQQKVLVQELLPVEAQILQALTNGRTIAEALTPHANSLSPEKISQLFEMMMKAGIIEDVMSVGAY